MATTPAFLDHCLELLASAGPSRAKRMFGGHGLYVDELFVALIIGDRLYLKTDDATRPRFEAEGCEPFVYDGHDGQVTVSYWSAPEDAMESPALMQPWARLAVEAALRARSRKRPATARKRSSAPASAASTAAPARPRARRAPSR
jgi:DNA transformation protein